MCGVFTIRLYTFTYRLLIPLLLDEKRIENDCTNYQRFIFYTKRQKKEGKRFVKGSVETRHLSIIR